MKKVIVFILILMIFSGAFNAKAQESTYSELYEESGLSGVEATLSEDVKEVLSDLGIDPSSYDSWSAASNENLLEVIKGFFLDRFKRPLSSLIMAFSVILIYAVFGGLWRENTGVSESYSYLCALSVASVVLMPMMSAVGESIEAIKAAGGLMLGFIPVFCMILVSAGSVSTAMLYEGLMLGICEAVTSVCSFLISPFIGVYICLGMSAAVSGNDGIYKLASSIKTAATWVLGLLMTIFTGFLSMQSVITKAADNMTVKTTKFFVGSFIPVVGGALSEALTTVTAGIGMLRSGAAVWCIAAVAVIMLPIIIELFIWKICLSLLASLSGMFSVSTAEKVFSISGIAINFLIALILSVMVMFILSLVTVSGGG